jgi:hypothetical protein
MTVEAICSTHESLFFTIDFSVANILLYILE